MLCHYCWSASKDGTSLIQPAMTARDPKNNPESLNDTEISISRASQCVSHEIQTWSLFSRERWPDSLRHPIPPLCIRYSIKSSMLTNCEEQSDVDASVIIMVHSGRKILHRACGNSIVPERFDDIEKHSVTFDQRPSTAKSSTMRFSAENKLVRFVQWSNRQVMT